MKLTVLAYQESITAVFIPLTSVAVKEYGYYLYWVDCNYSWRKNSHQSINILTEKKYNNSKWSSTQGMFVLRVLYLHNDFFCRWLNAENYRKFHVQYIRTVITRKFGCCMCIKDGEHILKIVLWQVGNTFGWICDSYVAFVNSKYTKNAVDIYFRMIHRKHGRSEY